VPENERLPGRSGQFRTLDGGELVKAADQYIPIQEAWIFKEKKFESSPSSALMPSVNVPSSGLYDGCRATKIWTPRTPPLPRQSTFRRMAPGVMRPNRANTTTKSSRRTCIITPRPAAARRGGKGGGLDLGILS